MHNVHSKNKPRCVHEYCQICQRNILAKKKHRKETAIHACKHSCSLLFLVDLKGDALNRLAPVTI